MKQYLDILQDLVNKYERGSRKEDRTGTGTVSKFGTQLRFNLMGGNVPCLTTKRLHLKSILHELIWFFKGSGNIKYLQDNGVKIWDKWADEYGNLGPVYPEMWRQWPGNAIIKSDHYWGDSIISNDRIDQLQNVIDSIRMNPTSRRHIVSAWNPALLSQQALPPCHTIFQFNCEEIPLNERISLLDRLAGFVSYPEDSRYPAWLDRYNIPKYYLDCQLYQRSADWFLGVPFNIVSYSVLTHIIGKLTNTYPREFIHTFGDYHLYLNHIEQAREQLKRTPTEPKAIIILDSDKWKSIDDVKYEHINIVGYEAQPNIKAPVAV